jgi:hypothetical protein
LAPVIAVVARRLLLPVLATGSVRGVVRMADLPLSLALGGFLLPGFFIFFQAIFLVEFHCVVGREK